MEKRYHFETIEKQMQEFWEKEQIYRFDPDKKGRSTPSTRRLPQSADSCISAMFFLTPRRK